MFSTPAQKTSREWLILFLGFSFAIGSEINQLLNFELSKIFSVFLLISFVVVLTDMRGVLLAIPRIFTLFIAYISFQMILNYFDSTLEDKSYHLFKFILFVTIIPVSMYVLSQQRLFEIFSISYSAGVILTGTMSLIKYLAIGNANSTDLSIRISGGYLDPNSFGTSAAVATLLLSYVILTHNLSRKQHVKLFTLVLLNLIFLNLSQSRSVFLSMSIFMVLLYHFSTSLVNSSKIKSALRWILPLFIMTFFILPMIKPDNMSRLNIVNRISEGKEPRVQIWRDYISVDEFYLFRGARYYHNPRGEKSDSPLKTTFDTHNKFLNIYFEAGLIALIIFVLCLAHLLWISWTCHTGNPGSIFLGCAVIAWCVMMFFEDYQGSRDYFLLFGLFIGIRNRICGKSL